MKKSIQLIKILMISISLVFSTHATSNTIAFEDDFINEIDLTDTKIIKSKQVSKERLESRFNHEIRKAKRKSRSLEEAVFDLEKKLDISYAEALKAQKKLNQPRQLKKLKRKLQRVAHNISSDEIIQQITKLVDRQAFEFFKENMLNELITSGSEVKFLEEKKRFALSQVYTASLGEKNQVRKIASDYPEFSEVFTYTVILGLSVYGTIVLAVSGTILAIAGIVVLGTISLILVLVGLTCVLQIICESKRFKHINGETRNYPLAVMT